MITPDPVNQLMGDLFLIVLGAAAIAVVFTFGYWVRGAAEPEQPKPWEDPE
jgi:hypothetical protein